MVASRLSIWVSVAGAVLLASAVVPPSLLAFDDPPAPKIDCTKKANKTKPACKPSRGMPSDDELYHAAYWLARGGQYEAALGFLVQANQSDPRILNYTGFVTRKLGDVDRAMLFYGKALEINPDYTRARAYLGEAFLQKGDVVSAEGQLGEIEKRCGQACTEYADLADHIARFKAATRG